MTEHEFSLYTRRGNGDTGAKNLVINTALCDARNVSEETLRAYDSITINAAVIATTAASRELLHKYNTLMDAGEIIDVPANAEFSVQNGKYTISASDPGGSPAVLIVNGKLIIEKGAQAALERYISIQVNGLVTYPRSLAHLMGRLKVNGSTECYPDDAVLCKNTFVPDKVFALRTKGGKYYAKNRVVLVDADLDVAALAAKGVEFLTDTAIIAEPLLEAALPMFAEETAVIGVPAGCAFVDDDAELSEALLRRGSGALCVQGDLSIPAEAGELLAQLKFLRVSGKVRLPKPLTEAFMAIDAQYGGLTVIRGTLLSGKQSLRLDKSALERCTEGVTVADCVELNIAADIPTELILERLVITDCVNVRCTPAQHGAVEQVSSEVVNIDDEDDSVTFSGTFGGDDTPRAETRLVFDKLKENKIINAANYVM
ncbi:MAG: hypothetical protein RRY09_06805, partial [Oscillospiraceae bacterium]